MNRRALFLVAPVIVAAGTLGCEPTSITEARDQLGRGGARTFTITLPVAERTWTVDSILRDLAGVPIDSIGELIAVGIEPESLSIAVGDELRFDDLGFDRFAFSFAQMLRTDTVSTTVSRTIAPPAGAAPFRAAQQAGDTLQFATPDGSSVKSATVDTGTVRRKLTNNSDCRAKVTMGLVDGDGTTVITFPEDTVEAQSSQTDSLVVDNKTFSQFLRVDIAVDSVGACAVKPGDGVATDVTFLPMTLSAVELENVSEDFTDTYDVLASERRIRVIDTVRVASGGFTITGQNKLPVALTVDLTLNGILGPSGVPLTGRLSLPAAAGDGSTKSGTLSLDLGGATVVPAKAVATVTGQATAASATITPRVTSEAVVVTATGKLEVASLVGRLDPDSTPELKVKVEEWREIPSANLDLGEFEDVVRDATLNTVRVALTIRNGADVPVQLGDFRLGAVRIDAATNQPRRDADGNFVFERDTANSPIFVTRTIAVGRDTTTVVTLEDAATVALVDRLVDLLLDDVRVVIVGSGTAVVGDGSRARITSSDAVRVRLDLTVGLDFTIPASGVSFDSSLVADGLAADSSLRRRLSEFTDIVDTASATAEVSNRTAFNVEVSIALVGDSVAGDVFTAPGRIVLNPLTIGAGTVDASGRVTAPSTGRVATDLTGEQAKVFLNERFTAGLRVRLVPPPGGRGAIGRSDQVTVRASVTLKMRTGGAR